MRDDLQMTPEAMLDLARRTAELVVERTGKLPEENAWDGEFRQILKDQLMERPHGISCRSRPGWTTPAASDLSRHHPPGPGCWLIS